jgi:hypothetical protein
VALRRPKRSPEAKSAVETILLQNDFERSATKFLIQEFNGQRKIDSSGGLLGFDCCVLDACRRLLQHNRD